MNVSHVLYHLNQNQREAVAAAPGHYLILAGAGSGKTRVLTHRIVWLNEVNGVPTHSMMAVTFTNKAAGEIQQRIDLQLRHGKRGMWIGTFHSLAHRLLRLHWNDATLPENFQVIDSDDQLRLVKRVIQSLGLNDTLFLPNRRCGGLIHRKMKDAAQSTSNPSHTTTGSRLSAASIPSIRSAATALVWSIFGTAAAGT